MGGGVHVTSSMLACLCWRQHIFRRRHGTAQFPVGFILDQYENTQSDNQDSLLTPELKHFALQGELGNGLAKVLHVLNGMSGVASGLDTE